METLWIYGDSFSEQLNDRRQWHNLVAARLSMTQNNSARPGAANDYSWYCMQQQYQLWQPGDCVIVNISATDRCWMFEEWPHFSSPHVVAMDHDLSEEQRQAVKLRYQYLTHSKAIEEAMTSRLGWLCHAALQQSAKVVLLVAADLTDHFFDKAPGMFPQITICQGNLKQISTEELEEDGDFQKLIMIMDPRMNHLCADNHQILAKALIDILGGSACPKLDDLPWNTRCLRSDNWDHSDFVKQQIMPNRVLALKKIIPPLSRTYRTVSQLLFKS